MPNEPVVTSDAPSAIGPYTQAVRVPVAAGARFIFCSGQIPLDPQSGSLVGNGDVRAEAVQVMKNLLAVLAAAGAGPGHIVRTTVYLVNLAHFAVVNEVYGSHFAASPPARATVQVAALPRGAQVEIDAIAVLS